MVRLKELVAAVGVDRLAHVGFVQQPVIRGGVSVARASAG
jgi:hypothetical protein